MIDDEETKDIVSWTGDGKQFTIHQLNEFSAKLLPNNFKHSNFSSFVRQLNSYVRAVLCSVVPFSSFSTRVDRRVSSS